MEENNDEKILSKFLESSFRGMISNNRIHLNKLAENHYGNCTEKMRDV